MANAEKLSISMAKDDVKWLRKRARSERRSLSSVLAEATQLLKQRAAQERLLKSFGKDAEVSDEEAAEIRKLWA